jgi:hypothetical protein
VKFIFCGITAKPERPSGGKGSGCIDDERSASPKAIWILQPLVLDSGDARLYFFFQAIVQIVAGNVEIVIHL